MERAVAPAPWTVRSAASAGPGWVATEPVEVDTVTFGAFLPMAFEKAGLYDEELVRNQDDELNLRIRRRRAGGSCSTPSWTVY